MDAIEDPFLEALDSDQRLGSRETVCWHGEMRTGRNASACTVLDISPYGARLLTGVAVTIELPVTLNLGSRGVYNGEIRWHDAGLVGVKFRSGLDADHRIVQDQSTATDSGLTGPVEDLGARVYEWRNEPRRNVTHRARLNIGRTQSDCRILDLSPSGARLLATRPLAPGCQVSLTAASQDHLHGRVVWSIGEICGLRFEQPDQGLIRRLADGS